MAKAKRIPAPPVPQPPDTIELELTIDEAQFLTDLMGRIAGSPTKSRRGLADAIAKALNAVGLQLPYRGIGFDKQYGAEDLSSSHIYVKDTI